ncbi:MAG: LysR family transcriptional regulator [Proteobacteria bacterium]|nr:LysR family transcriptional regulator [Pseudomonadota bacterium]
MKSKNRGNPTPDLNHVFLFVEVVRANSFAAAARRLGMPANSVSRKIQELEAQVGSRLIHRSTRKLTLTAAGRTFFDRCAGPVSELAQAGQASVDETQLASGVVRVAAPADFFDLFPIEWIVQFLEAHPRVRMEFVLDDAKADLIGEGIDVALRAAHNVDDNLIGHKIVATQFDLVASPAYLAARGTPETFASLADHDCLPQSNRTGPVTWRLIGPAGEGEIEVSSRFRANTARAVLRAALAGLGIALLPHPVIASEMAAGRLVRVLPEYRRDGADFYAVCVSRRHIPRAVSAFIEFAVEKLRGAMSL